MQLCNLPAAHGLHHKAHGPEELQSCTRREQPESRGARLTWDETTDPESRPAKRPYEIHVSAPK